MEEDSDLPEDGAERDLHDAEALLVEGDLVYADGLLRGLLVPENALTQEQLARVLLGLARVEGLRGRDARSERYLREALRHNPYNENVAHLLGEVAEQRGAAKEATSWSQQAEFHDRDPLPESRDSLEGRRGAVAATSSEPLRRLALRRLRNLFIKRVK